MKKTMKAISMIFAVVLVLSIATTAFAASASSVTATKDDPSWGYMTMRATNVSDSSGIASVRFAIWSQENGQDDLKWVYAVHDSATNSWYTTLKYSHNWGSAWQDGGWTEIGVFNVHAYAINGQGVDSFLGATTINIEELT